MEKRLVIAVALSVLIIMTFQYLAPKPPAIPVGQNAAEQMRPTDNGQEKTPVPAKARPVEEKIFTAETDKFDISFSNIGGAIKEIKLKDFTGQKTGESAVLCKITDPSEYIGNISSTQYPGISTNSYDIKNEEGNIVCSWRGEGISVTKRYKLYNLKRYIELEVLIKNTSPEIKKIDYRIIGGAGITETKNDDKRLIEVNGNIGGKYYGFKHPRNGTIINSGIVGWSALKNKYFSVILRPFDNFIRQFYMANKDGLLIMGVDSDTIILSSGSVSENKFLIYAGPSQIDELKKVGYGLEESVNYGFFGFISKALIVFMKIFYSIVHSWGVAIILLSIFLNIILFPLTMKSFRSIQKMQELHPQMEKLKVQYKDNPSKLNKEMMGLYKTYNINPMSGCLPMLLQMPIFVALYQALLRSIELRGAKFLWVKDLSMPDAVDIPITLPILGNTVNILPIVMIIAMVVQQKISTKSMGAAVTEDQRQQQKIMLVMMPVVFGFIFYNMPSGLVLYWVVNTILTVVEQGAILKKQ